MKILCVWFRISLTLLKLTGFEFKFKSFTDFTIVLINNVKICHFYKFRFRV